MRNFFLRRFYCIPIIQTGVLALALPAALWGQAPNPPRALPPAPGTTQVPGIPKLPTPALQPPSVVITIEQAIDFAKRNNPTLQANRTLIYQNREQEVTANLRPNPVLTVDAQFLPIFTPDMFTSNYINYNAEFDAGIAYLFERGKKRQHRLQAARDQTAVTEAQVTDAERTTVESAAQEFITALLAKSNLEFAEQFLQSYEHSVGISQEQFKAGGLSKSDLLKIQLQTLQFQTDVTAARIARVQALGSLRQLMGFGSVPRDYDVAGDLAYRPITLKLEDLQARALKLRPDLQAAERSVEAAKSQIGLAKANAKQDVTFTFDYSHVNASNNGSFFFSIPLPIFNRNQGEVARTYFALTQSQFQQSAAEQQVLTDVRNAYEALLNGEEVVQLYEKGYLQQAQQSLDITQFSYQHGAASLLDFLDAERTYRATELSYRQALATYMNAVEQLRQAVGTRDLQ
ncbi:MAG TPA: TolC family protein [Terriglobales bacterium]|nr:TolC family protein [Terriglobales bacterium]